MGDWFEEWFDADYARLYAHRDAAEARTAVAMALREAPELARGPVLDLGCGSGRHLERLRGTNPLAFGMDLSPTLLRTAPAPLHPWLLRGDMRKLPVKAGSLSGICLWFTPFGYFSDEANARLLADLGIRLHPGGVVLLDYLNADETLRTLVPEDEAERDGLRIRSRRLLEGDRLVKRMEILRLATGETREALESVRIYRPGELTALAEAAGLHLRCARGTYAGEPYGASSPRWIAFFQRH